MWARKQHNDALTVFGIDPANKTESGRDKGDLNVMEK